MQRPKLLPPHYFAAAIAAMGALHFLLPLYRWLSPPWTFAGGVLLIVGIAMSANASGLFTRAQTPVVPFERSTALVTAGIFGWTRNPMYLGLIVALAGVAIVLGTLSPLCVLPVFIQIIRVRFVAGEERFLEGIFGERYLAYKQTVRRWI